ncbi:MAG: DUF4214 domain-containing protein [Gammaproteobacteria bacterium]|nr:MAG: DUF4214 domain-containing protein [Gammaproteobacteria bacterium]
MMKLDKFAIIFKFLILTFSLAVSSVHAQNIDRQTHEYVTQQVYVAMFGRAADRAGEAWFANSLRNIGAPTNIVQLNQAYDTNYQVRALIDSYTNSAEFQRISAGSSESYLYYLYNTLFNRSPDVNGAAYWKALIDTGSVTRGRAALAILASSSGTYDGYIAGTKSDYAYLITRDLVWNYQIDAYNRATQDEIRPGVTYARAMLASINSWYEVRPAVDAMASKYRQW